MAAIKTLMHENANSFLPEGCDLSQQEMKALLLPVMMTSSLSCRNLRVCPSLS